MNIGIDLDNTIINYDKRFVDVASKKKYINKNWKGVKQDLKEEIKKLENGNAKWNKVQSIVYGDLSKKVFVNIGFYEFLWRAKLKKHNIFIISHKTIHPHYNKNIFLRDEANKFLNRNNIIKLVGARNIYYTDSLKDKICLINSKNLDWFIDDLEEVLNNTNISINLKKIKYSKYKCENIETTNNWYKISDIIFGKVQKYEYKNFIKNEYKDFNITSIKTINTGISNSNTYQLYTAKNKYVCKYYPISETNCSRSRLETEILAYTILDNNKILNIPKLRAVNKNLNCILFDYVNGEKIRNYNETHITHAVRFIKRLKKVNFSKNRFNFLAKEAITSINDLFSQITKRLLKLEGINTLDNSTRKHVNNIKYYLNVIRKKYQISISQNEIIPKSKLVLSPSDFGFHNALSYNDDIVWLDFEYFGFDDPAKLIIDFILHPGMNLNKKLARDWFLKISKIFKTDKDINMRMRQYWPLICIRWCLIILLKSDKSDWVTQRIKSEETLKRIDFPYYLSE